MVSAISPVLSSSIGSTAMITLFLFSIIALNVQVSSSILRFERTLGLNGDAPSEYLFSDPRSIATDSKGNFYVVERAEMSVRLYDKKGIFVRRLGKRGSEIGRFRDISCMCVDGRDNVVVLDYVSARITVFDRFGVVMRTDSIDRKRMAWPRKIVALPDGKFLVVYVRATNDGIFHVFDSVLRHELDTFGKLQQFGENQRFEAAYLANFPGSIFVSSSGRQLYFSPRCYYGDIFLFVLDDATKRWSLKQTIKGYVEKREPYTLLTKVTQTQAPSKRECTLQMFGPWGQFSALIHNESRGLFVLNDKRLVHFTLIEHGQDLVFGMEVFSNRGQLEKYWPIQSRSLSE